jgi:hypothetical protein
MELKEEIEQFIYNNGKVDEKFISLFERADQIVKNIRFVLEFVIY